MLRRQRTIGIVGKVRRAARQGGVGRLCFTLWFLLTSVGLPFDLLQIGEQSCARNPEAQCRCSLKKRLSGTCCCRRETVPQVAKSCCSVKKSSPKTAEPASSACCSAKGRKNELSIARCDCDSETPESVSLVHEPRLLAADSVISPPPAIVAFLLLSVDRIESAPLLPPVPPPKVVLADV